MSDCLKSLPRKVRVGSYTYRLELVPPDHVELKGETPDEDADGLTVLDRMRVYLNETMSAERALTVVLHELQHIINFVYAIEDGSDEEHVATQSGVGWFSVWMENPRLLNWVKRTTIQIKKETKQ